MIKLISCVGIDYDLQLLPHFLKHYSKLDIEIFHLIIHSNSDFDIDKFANPKLNLKLEKWVGKFDGVTKTNKLNQIIEQTEQPLILMADVDEFQIWDRPLEGYVWGRLRDREAPGEELIEISDKNIEEQFPLITKRTLWADLDKPCLFPSTDRLLSPHHLRDNKNTRTNLIDIDHYRWAKGRIEKSIERRETYNKLNKQGVRLEANIWKNIPNWESDIIISMYRKKSLL
jgi:hypothetical protein